MQAHEKKKAFVVWANSAQTKKRKEKKKFFFLANHRPGSDENNINCEKLLLWNPGEIKKITQKKKNPSCKRF